MTRGAGGLLLAGQIKNVAQDHTAGRIGLLGNEGIIGKGIGDLHPVKTKPVDGEVRRKEQRVEQEIAYGGGHGQGNAQHCQHQVTVAHYGCQAQQNIVPPEAQVKAEEAALVALHQSGAFAQGGKGPNAGTVDDEIVYQPVAVGHRDGQRQEENPENDKHGPHLIHQRQDSSLLLSELEEYGYPVYQPYGLLYIHLANPAAGLPVSPLTQANRLSLSIEHKLRSLSLQSHLCSTDSYCIVLIPQQELHRMESAAREIRDFISLQYPSLQFSIGISSRAATLANLPRAFFHARSSAMIALARGKDLLSFDDLGIFQILLSVTDRGILRDYARRHLHAAEAYDRENQSNCTEVLHQYLLHSGSIQRIAEAMYCHRNTINKKVRALRENLGYDLSDPNVRFELMLAFCIRDYLKISL